MNGSSRASSDPTFGYLASVEDSVIGVTGGYLIVSATGRPLEFHCTAPVQPSRAQEILFGPTLRPHLLGEQIGRALVDRARIKPTALLIDDADLAQAGEKRQTPLVLITEPEAAPPAGWRALPLAGEGKPLWTRDAEADDIRELIASLSQAIEIAEPFDRIGEAIREAQRLGQAGTEEGAVHRDAA